jgi:hypothetical protein
LVVHWAFTLGTALGDALGSRLGLALGPALGDALGSLLGDELGTRVGNEFGLLVGGAGVTIGLELGVFGISLSTASLGDEHEASAS